MYAVYVPTVREKLKQMSNSELKATFTHVWQIRRGYFKKKNNNNSAADRSVGLHMD